MSLFHSVRLVSCGAELERHRSQVIIIPPAVVLTNRKNDKSNAVAEGQVVTTVIDGRTELVTKDGITRVSVDIRFELHLFRGRAEQHLFAQTQLTTLNDGQVSTITSFVAVPDITVSQTSLSEVLPGTTSRLYQHPSKFAESSEIRRAFHDNSIGRHRRYRQSDKVRYGSPNFDFHRTWRNSKCRYSYFD